MLAPSAAAQTSPFLWAVENAERALSAGRLDEALRHIQSALERDANAPDAWALRARWAKAAGDTDEQVWSLHRELGLRRSQGTSAKMLAGLEVRIRSVDPLAAELFRLKDKFTGRLEPLADRYEKDGRPHSAIRVHRQILALDPGRVESEEAIQRIASAPDPSLAADAQPKDLLADISAEWIAEFDAAHDTWDNRAKDVGRNYVTYTDAGYEVLVRAAEAMEQMNGFYRQFFQYGTEEDGRAVPRINLNIFATRDEYLALGIGPPVEWSGGHFTGGAVETYIGPGGFQETVSTLFHEAAHQFVSLATRAAGWLNEGLASFFEGTRILANGTVIMNLPANHRLLPLAVRMERGWMDSPTDGLESGDVTVPPQTAPTWRIILENRYSWGPPWYAPTWGVVYFLYNVQDQTDGRFLYREAFGEFVNASGGRSGEGAVTNFESVVLAQPSKPTKGVDFPDDAALPTTVAELDGFWKDWILALRDEQSGRGEAFERPWLAWAGYALKRGEPDVAFEHFEKGLLERGSDVDLLLAFADFLHRERDDSDRASKLVRRALRALESTETVDASAVTAAERLLKKYDPRERTLETVRIQAVETTTVLAGRYLERAQHLMAMELAWGLGVELDAPELLDVYEVALRQSGKSIRLWELAYNETDLRGWNTADKTVWRPNGSRLEAVTGAFSEDVFDYRFLTLDRVTSGDFSLEADVLAETGKVNFAGLVFGRKDASNFHSLIYFPPRAGAGERGTVKTGFLDLTTFQGADSFQTWRHASAGGAEPVGATRSQVWHALRLDVTGASVDVWFDGKLVATHDFPSPAVLRGEFGLLSGRGEASFRNVRFLALPPDDPGAAIERQIRLEALKTIEGRIGDSWVGLVPPFPSTARWAQGSRQAWDDKGTVPTLLVLWSIAQNDMVRIDEWLVELARRNRDTGLRVVSVASALDNNSVDAYLEDHPMPGAVAVDSRVRDARGIGDTFGDYAIATFNLPRLVLLDVDHRVAWEGDPGFTAGELWSRGQGSYLDASLEELLDKRRIRESGAWRNRWMQEGVDALNVADMKSVLPLLREAAALEGSLESSVLEAAARLDALESAFANLPEVAADFAAQGRDPALGTLLDWMEMAGQVVPGRERRNLTRFRRSDAAMGWKAALALARRHGAAADRGRPVEREARLVELAALPGAFTAELTAMLRGTPDAGWGAVADGAEQWPALWLVHAWFAWTGDDGGQ